MNFRYAVFDMDGTLIKSMDAWDRCEREVVGSLCGVNLVSGKHADFVYTSLNDLIERAFSISGIRTTRSEVLPILYENMQPNYDNNSIKCVDGAIEFLKFIRSKGVKVAIATATDFDMCKICLDDNGLLPLVDAFVSTGEVGKSKRHPDVYLKAMELIGANSGETLVFEDSRVCLETLMKNNFRFAVVHDGERSKSIPQNIIDKAEHYIYDYTELIK